MTLFGFHVTVPVLVLGALTGITYGLLAVGLVLIYRTSRIINFAQGQMGVFGVAVLGLLGHRWHVPYYLAVIPALAAGGLSAGVTEMVVVRRLRRAPRLMSIVATLGVGAVLAIFAIALYPEAASANGLPSPAGMPVFQVGALRINQAYGAMLVFGPLAVLALTVFLRRSRLGLGIRCSSANPEAARMAGISANNMSLLAWVLSGVVSAMTAILVIPASGLTAIASFGPTLLLRALAAGVIARMTSLPVAFGAGLGLGVLQQLLLYNYPNSNNLADVVLYVIILGALLAQRGIRGREEEKGSWAAVSAWQPLSRAVSRLPEVRLLRWGSATAAMALALIVPAVVSNSADTTLTLILALSMVGLSVGIVTGLGGQLSLGQFGVAAAGAVVSFHVSQKAPFALALVYAGLAGAAVSLIIGLPALRLKGLMLAVTTIGFALMASSWALGQPWALGEQIVPRHPAIFGARLDTGRSYYYLALGLFLLALLVAWNTRRLGLGRALLAVRDNEDNARAFTLPARRLKLEGFILAGFLAGMAGSVYIHSLYAAGPATFPVDYSIDVVAMTVIGGMSILLGPLLGAFYIIGLPTFVHLGTAALAATQLGWLVLILYLPGGIGQGLEPIRTRFVGWAAKRHGIDVDATPSLSTPAHRLNLSGLARPGQSERARAAVMLEGRRLRKTFGGVLAVRDVSLCVRQGEVVGLIGPNGAGKTTTFELLSGFTRPDRGEVIFDGLDVSDMTPEQRGRLGLVRSFQDAALFPTLSVIETLRLAFEPALPTSFFGSVVGLPGTERAKRARADELVELMGLAPYRFKQIQELSTGTRRITELACMVALSPALLLLDEPSSGVAQRETEALGLLLGRLKQELNLSMLIIEHDMPLIMGISDRVVAMHLGAVIADDTPAAVQANPAVIEGYLGTDTSVINRSDRHTHPVATSPPVPATNGSTRRRSKEKA